jgi:hypothetical protein
MKLLSTSFVFFPQTKRPCLIKRKISGVGRVAKVVENLPCKNKALSSNPSTIGKKKKRERNRYLTNPITAILQNTLLVPLKFLKVFKTRKV